MVPDDDIISYFGKYKNGALEAYGKMINHIMIEWDRLIMTQKEFLPAKAKKADWPLIIWIKPPVHENFRNNVMRQKFTKALQNMAKFHDNTRVLQLKKIWDSHNNNLFIKECNRFTAEGTITYW